MRLSLGWFGDQREQVGLFPWEQTSWLVYMPTALVSDEVTIDGRTYLINDARGYHYHNWGEWKLTTVTWNWAQYSEPGLTLAADRPLHGRALAEERARGVAVGDPFRGQRLQRDTARKWLV